MPGKTRSSTSLGVGDTSSTGTVRPALPCPAFASRRVCFTNFKPVVRLQFATRQTADGPQRPGRAAARHQRYIDASGDRDVDARTEPSG